MPTSTSLDSSALSFHHPIDAGLRRGAGALGFGFLVTALLLVVAVAKEQALLPALHIEVHKVHLVREQVQQ